MELTDFARQSRRAKSIAELMQLAESYLLQQQVTCFAFTYYDQHPSSKRPVRYEFASAAIRPWHDYFLESGFEDVDQTLRWSKQAVLPLVWDLQTQLQSAKSPREQRIREESIAYGIARGASVPIHGPGNDFATLTIYQLKHQQIALERYLPYWQSVGMYLYGGCRRLLMDDVHIGEQNNFTRREQQCLYLTSQGYSVDDIAQTLSITPRTVNFHLQNANKKMGTKSKYQTLMKL